MTYKITPLKYAIHTDTENPIFGDEVTHVSIDDEAAGAFLVLEQDGNTVRLDFEELAKVNVAAEILRRRYESFGESL